MQIKTKKTLTCLALAIMATGCNGDNKTNANTRSYIAKVNGDEITFNQFDAEVKSSKLANHTDPQARAQLLSKMIDRQLLAQESIKLNLERMPEVIDAVNSAKAQIYAQAYLAQKLAKVPSPIESEIANYIESHPETFAHRKVFSTNDVIFAYDSQSPDEMQAIQANVTDMKTLQATLDERKIKYNIINGSFSMDALPAVWAEKLKRVKVGDLLFTHDMTKVVVKSISDISESPMPDEDSKNYAAKVLFELKKQEFLTNELARLRKLAQISTFDNKTSQTDRTQTETNISKPATIQALSH